MLLLRAKPDGEKDGATNEDEHDGAHEKTGEESEDEGLHMGEW